MSCESPRQARIAAQSDRRGRYVQVSAAGYVGDDKFLLTAKRRFFTLQNRPHMIQICRVELRIAAGQFDNLVWRERHENETGGQHR